MRASVSCISSNLPLVLYIGEDVVLYIGEDVVLYRTTQTMADFMHVFLSFDRKLVS